MDYDITIDIEQQVLKNVNQKYKTCSFEVLHQPEYETSIVILRCPENDNRLQIQEIIWKNWNNLKK